MKQKCVFKSLCTGYSNPVAHDGPWSGSLVHGPRSLADKPGLSSIDMMAHGVGH